MWREEIEGKSMKLLSSIKVIPSPERILLLGHHGDPQDEAAVHCQVYPWSCNVRVTVKKEVWGRRRSPW